MKTILSIFAVVALAFPAHAIETVLLTGSIADANENGQADVDLSSLKGTAAFVLTAKSIAGTSPTAAIKLQSSPPAVLGASMRTGTTAGVALRTATNSHGFSSQLRIITLLHRRKKCVHVDVYYFAEFWQI
jgi:hypothetical protein